MEFLLGVFAAITFWQFAWFVVLVFIGVLSASAEESGPIGFFILVVFFLLGLHFIVNVPVMSFIAEHPGVIALAFIGYSLLGGIYTMFISWPRWLKSKASEMQKDYDLWAKESPLSQRYNPKDKSKEAWLETTWYKNHYSAAGNKSLIFGMILNWIWDAIWTVVHDPIRWLTRKVYDIFAKSYERIAKKITLQNITKDGE